MGKTISRLLIASVVLFIVGIAFCAVSVAGGVDYREANIGGNKVKLEKVEKTFEGQIKNLDISVCSGRFEVKKGDKFELVGTDVPENALECEVKDGTLRIKDKSIKKSGFHIDLFGIEWTGWSPDKKITLYIPGNSKFENVTIAMAAGKTTLEGITTEEADLTMSAGKFTAKNLITTKKTRLRMDAGKMDLDNVSLHNTNIHVSAGQGEVNGALYGENEVDVSAGGMEIQTELKESEYDFTTDVTAGSIKVNDHSMKHHENAAGATNKMNLTCSAGSIRVETN